MDLGRKWTDTKPSSRKTQEDTFKNGEGQNPDFSRSFSSYVALAMQRGGLSVMAVNNYSCRCLLRWLTVPQSRPEEGSLQLKDNHTF